MCCFVCFFFITCFCYLFTWFYNDFTFIISLPKYFVLYLQLLYQKRSVSFTRNAYLYNSPHPKAAPTPPLWGVWAALKFLFLWYLCFVIFSELVAPGICFALYLQLLYRKRSVSLTRNAYLYNSPRPKAAPTPPLWGVWAVLKPSWGRRIRARRFVECFVFLWYFVVLMFLFLW